MKEHSAGKRSGSKFIFLRKKLISQLYGKLQEKSNFSLFAYTKTGIEKNKMAIVIKRSFLKVIW